MRRAAIVVVRSLIVLLLVAAALDLPLPRPSGDRVRVHLVDGSDSVRIPGPPESLTLKNAREIIDHDRDVKRPDDVVTWASFGRNGVAWESSEVLSTGTDLARALEAALGRNPTEIVLYTDGRADPKNALFLCRQRGVPVHVLPLGPTSVRDVRFRRIAAPPSARAGTAYAIEVVVESTVDLACKVSVGEEVRDVTLSAGVPAALSFRRAAPGPFEAKIDAADDCPANNRARGEVFLESDQPRVLALSEGLSLPGVDLTVAPRASVLGEFDAVVLDNVELSAADQQQLAAYVRGGGGLLMLGGRKSYALGRWRRTPLEPISPFKIHPDLKLAVVLGIDASGSMASEFESVVRTLEEAANLFDADDDLMGLTFGDHPKVLPVAALRKERPSGGTSVAGGIREARRHLESRKDVGRKVIVLMTDGELTEKPEEIQAEIARLKDIGLFVITTRKKIPGVENIEISDWKKLSAALEGVSVGIQDPERRGALTLDLREHPVTAGVPPAVLPWINRTSARPLAQVLATVGTPPQQDPAIAVQGRVVGFAFPYDAALSRLFRQALDFVIGDRAAGLSLSVDPPLVVAQGTYPHATFETEGMKVEMKQVAPDRWEGRLPEDVDGPVRVRKGRARASATIACPPELAALGVDRSALERIANETGGRLLASTAELDALPRPEHTTPRSGRAAFLIAALILVFVELGVSIYWKV